MDFSGYCLLLLQVLKVSLNVITVISDSCPSQGGRLAAIISVLVFLGRNGKSELNTLCKGASSLHIWACGSGSEGVWVRLSHIRLAQVPTQQVLGVGTGARSVHTLSVGSSFTTGEAALLGMTLTTEANKLWLVRAKNNEI